MINNISVLPIEGMPLIESGDSLPELIYELTKSRSLLIEGDIIVICHTIVSKSEGRIHYLNDVKYSASTARMAEYLRKDPRLLEIILQNSRRIVRMTQSSIICEAPHGFICANAGVDRSNAPDGSVISLPEQPDVSASLIREALKQLTGISKLAVIITDTFGRPHRKGTTNVAIGISGISPFTSKENEDLYGRPLVNSFVAYVDQIAGAAGLVMGEGNEGIPVAIVRGLAFETCENGSAASLPRSFDSEIFR